MRHLEQVCQHGRRLVCLQRVLHRVRIPGYQAHDVDGVGLCQEGEVGTFDFGGREVGFAKDAAEAGVRVLEVRTCVAFE